MFFQQEADPLDHYPAERSHSAAFINDLIPSSFHLLFLCILFNLHQEAHLSLGDVCPVNIGQVSPDS